MSVRIRENIFVAWQTTRASLPPKMKICDLLRSPVNSTVIICLILFGLEKLMDLKLSCPCKPGVNEVFVTFVFLVPALVAFTVMLVLRRPCRRRRWCGSGFTEGFLPCLAPPTFWLLFLLLDGQYLACGLTYWKGNYYLDNGEPPLTWCVPSSSSESVQRGLYQRYISCSQVAGLVLLLLICVGVVSVVGHRDCRRAADVNTPEEEEPLLQS